jgi:hypothetical protein
LKTLQAQTVKVTIQTTDRLLGLYFSYVEVKRQIIKFEHNIMDDRSSLKKQHELHKMLNTSKYDIAWKKKPKQAVYFVGYNEAGRLSKVRGSWRSLLATRGP